MLKKKNTVKKIKKEKDLSSTDTKRRFSSKKSTSFRKRTIEGKEEFEPKLVDLARVTRVTAGGKSIRFRALMVIGDGEGSVGIGLAKGLDVAQAIEKATRVAKKHLIEVPIVNNTIPHEVSAKFGAARVLLKPQRKGRGLVAGGVARVICNMAGIKNISSKFLGATKNKINNTKAVIKALKKLKKK